MTKLNEENQQWLKDHRNAACGGAYYTKDVEAKLLEMQEQHNASCREWRDVFEGMHQRAMKAENLLKQSKAEFIQELIDGCPGNGYNAVDVIDYLYSLKPEFENESTAT